MVVRVADIVAGVEGIVFSLILCIATCISFGVLGFIPAMEVGRDVHEGANVGILCTWWPEHVRSVVQIAKAERGSR